MVMVVLRGMPSTLGRGTKATSSPGLLNPSRWSYKLVLLAFKAVRNIISFIVWMIPFMGLVYATLQSFNSTPDLSAATFWDWLESAPSYVTIQGLYVWVLMGTLVSMTEELYSRCAVSAMPATVKAVLA